tara:strand:- start:2834 stop:3655 length:822 start_codon:yes stop_codon:yes gene_type:complete
LKISRIDLIKIIREEVNQARVKNLLEVDADGSGDLSPDELRDLADDLEGEPITGQELRDALISNISDMHKDIYYKRPNVHDLRQMTTEELEQEHDKISQTHKDWWYEERHREDQDMWLSDEEAEVEELMEPEEGEDEPKQIGMGRRPLVGPARDVRRGRKISESMNEVMVTLKPISQIDQDIESIESKWARIAGISESYDANRDGALDPDELLSLASDLEGDNPLVKRGGRHDRIPDYTYDNVTGVHVRNDYNPRTDYDDTLDKVLAQMGIRY